ncbi:HNH endonuclease [Streptomyces albofaciens JCM 4342]|uniref:HNH endonuclease signature motif containing protein n=1 Tax=Streptomyces albofaciens TaxID=66866 RepID=UPI000B135BFF|nr:HNH endonuclease signature motif containing protein [Streptomyces albofaciens]KAA6215127.1 HNH endonuclease [Streptomyces albofaciens JCM 4342]KAA6220626.1 HNH endonuclease [Streptomyces albofaciens JCM 4342]
MDRPTPAARFAAKVTTAGPWSLRRDCPGPCHLWAGATNEKGYGSFWVDGHTVKAHRYAYEQAHGPIPTGLEVDHRCRRRECVAPAHLDAVTHRTNILRSTNHVAARAAVTHCPAGHPYDQANTVRAKNGTRKCRTCKNASARAARAAKREAPLASVTPIRPTAPTLERAA